MTRLRNVCWSRKRTRELASEITADRNVPNRPRPSDREPESLGSRLDGRGRFGTGDPGRLDSAPYGLQRDKESRTIVDNRVHLTRLTALLSFGQPDSE